jgi:hypothetical protein
VPKLQIKLIVINTESRKALTNNCPNIGIFFWSQSFGEAAAKKIPGKINKQEDNKNRINHPVFVLPFDMER